MKKILIAFLLLTFMTPAFVATPALAADSIDMKSNVACTQKTKPMDIYKIRSQNSPSCEQARNNWLTSVKQNALAAHCNKKSTPNLQFKCLLDNTLESDGCTEICDSGKRQVAGHIYCVYLNNNEDIYDVPVLEITQDTAGKFSAQLKQNSHSSGQNKTPTSTITCKTSDSYKSNNQKSSGGNTNQSTSTSNNTAQAPTITGTVVDKDGEPVPMATVQLSNGKEFIIGTITDNNGNFTINDQTWQTGYSVRVSFMGYETQTITTKDGLNNIILKQATIELDEAVSQKTISGTPCCVPDTCTDCEQKCKCSSTSNYERECDNNYDGMWEKQPGDKLVCKPNNCKFRTYKLRPDGDHYICEFDTKNNKIGQSCKSQISRFDAHATDGTVIDFDKTTGEITQCTSDKCVKDFDKYPDKTHTNVNDETHQIYRCKQLVCPNDLMKTKYPHATYAIPTGWDTNTHNVTECKITECDTLNDWVLSTKQNKCVPNTCDCTTTYNPDTEECDPIDPEYCKEQIHGAETVELACNKRGHSYCKLISCMDDWKTDTKNNRCVSKVDCTSVALASDPNVKVASWSDDAHTECIIKACDKFYRVNTNTNKCELKGDADIGELKSKAEQAKQNEQSLENRINGAIGIGGVGIGGMMIGGALSEQAADEYAESDMAAYINTFRCEYGDGQTVAGGERNVTLPGGNELIDVYTQYARLSNDLKNRKTSLGLKPGIESEVIIDKSTSGLYDDVGVGVVGGGYASIARALLFPGGADAAAWDAQKAATASKLNTGIAVAGTAAVLTLANTMQDALKKLKNDIDNIPVKQPTCADFGLDGEYPNCDCKDSKKAFIAGDYNKCDPCLGEEIVITDESGFQKCACPQGTYGNSKHNCISQHKTCSQRGFNTNNVPHLYVWEDEDGQCHYGCNDDYIYDEFSISMPCTCPTEYNRIENLSTGRCEIKKDEAPDPEIIDNSQNTLRIEESLDDTTLAAGALFGKDVFKITEQEAKNSLDNFAKTITDDENRALCKIVIHGHTDTTASDQYNLGLSKKRANAVKEYLEKNTQFTSKVVITVQEHGETECYECKTGDENNCKEFYNDNEHKVADNTDYPACRRIVINGKCYLNEKRVTETTTPANQSAGTAN